ncbi:MAG: hypothetical protein WAR37_04505 [Candidatus Microsaccharimonas sp.]
MSERMLASAVPREPLSQTDFATMQSETHDLLTAIADNPDLPRELVLVHRSIPTKRKRSFQDEYSLANGIRIPVSQTPHLNPDFVLLKDDTTPAFGTIKNHNKELVVESTNPFVFVHRIAEQGESDRIVAWHQHLSIRIGLQALLPEGHELRQLF